MRGVAALLLGMAAAFGATPRFDVAAAGAGVGVGPQASVIELPMTIDLTSLFEEVERRVPRETGKTKGWKSWHGIEVKHRIWRGPLSLAMRGDWLYASAIAHYWVRARKRVLKLDIGASCGLREPPREVRIGLATHLTWSPDWRLVVTTYTYPNLYTNLCKMSMLQLNVTPFIDEKLRQRLVKFARRSIDAEVPRLINLRTRAETAWAELQKPIAVGANAWLLFRPRSIAVTPLQGEGSSVSALVSLHADPKVTFGGEPEVQQRPLPRLGVVRPGAGGFRVPVTIEMPYDEAARQLAARLARQEFAVAEGEVKVKKVGLTRSVDRLILRVELAGVVTGTITVSGMPSYDPESEVVTLEGVEFDVESSDPLIESLDDALHEPLRATLAERARWSLAARTDRARIAMERALNRRIAHGVSLRTELTEVKPTGMRLTNGGIVLDALVQGRAQLSVK